MGFIHLSWKKCHTAQELKGHVRGRKKKKNQTALKNVKPTSYAMTVAKIMKNVLHCASTLISHSNSSIIQTEFPLNI